MCAGPQRTALPDLDRHQYLPERKPLPMAANAQTGCSEPHDSISVEYRASVARGRSSKTLLSPSSVSPAHHVESGGEAVGGGIDSRGEGRILLVPPCTRRTDPIGARPLGCRTPELRTVLSKPDASP